MVINSDNSSAGGLKTAPICADKTFMVVPVPGAIKNREKLLAAANLAPPFSPILNRLLARMAHEDVQLSELAELIEKDTVLAGNILRTVNSVLYGMVSEVNSIQHAVCILGLEKVRKIALTMSFANLWRRGPDAPGWSTVRFNLHSTAVGILADLMVQNLPAEYPEGAFLAGLFHDFGKLLIAHNLGADYEIFNRRCLEKDSDWEAIEADLLGITHPELSASALARWKLPQPIVEAVRLHHAPEFTPGEIVPLGRVVQTADRCINKLGICVSAAAPEDAKGAAAELEALGLGDRASRLLDELLFELNLAKAFFN